MKYNIEVRDVEIPDKPKFFRAVITDESISDPTSFQHMALDNDHVSDLIRNVAIAISNRENGKK